MKCVYLVSLSYLWPTRKWCSGGNSWSHHRTVDKIAERPRSMQRTLLEQDSRQSARLIRKTRNEITPVGVYLPRFILHCTVLCRGSRLLEEGGSMTSSPENVEISSPRKRNFRHSEAKSACFKLSRFFYNNYSMSPSWIWSDKITNERVARVGDNHFISNKGEWNNCFSKFSNRVLPPIFISTIWQSVRKENF